MSIKRLVGVLFVVLSLIYVGHVMFSHRIWELDIDWKRLGWVIALAAILYGMACQLLAVAWVLALRAVGDKALNTREGWRIYARTNIAKYLPGNVFHFVGRHVWARDKGVLDTHLIAALTIESVLLLIAAGLWSAPFVAELMALVNMIDPWVWVAILMISLGVVGAVGWKLSKIKTGVSLRTIIFNQLRAMPFKFLQILGFYLVFFAICGGIGWALMQAIGAQESINVFRLVSIFAFSWVFGFVVPGAAAGIGVREATLIFTLSPFVGPETAIIIAVTYRLVTLLGDMMFFSAYLVKADRT